MNALARRVCVVVFVASWVAATQLYPGWNWRDPDAVGHDFWRNFLCDVMAARTLGGTDNRAGSIVVTIGVFVLTFGALLPLWWSVEGRGRRACRIAAVGTCVLLVATAAELQLQLPWSHGALTLGGGAFGLAATAIFLLETWSAPQTSGAHRALAATFIGAGLLNFVTYFATHLGWMPMHTVMPASQKVVVLALLAWLFLLRDRGDPQ